MIRKYLKELESFKLIRIQRQGVNKPNIYHFLDFYKENSEIFKSEFKQKNTLKANNKVDVHNSEVPTKSLDLAEVHNSEVPKVHSSEVQELHNNEAKVYTNKNNQ
jgi:hypothetical protein